MDDLLVVEIFPFLSTSSAPVTDFFAATPPTEAPPADLPVASPPLLPVKPPEPFSDAETVPADTAAPAIAAFVPLERGLLVDDEDEDLLLDDVDGVEYERELDDDLYEER
ncbi:hypothetical protein ELE45_30185 [Klebsiella pneumoniae]|nr:hypothetical protein [Klebsiella pneumoniae]